MKHLVFWVFTIVFFSSFTGISQTNKRDSIEAVKQQLLIKIYGNRNEQQIVDHDKSFVSDSRLYYEGLGGSPARNTYTDRDLIEKTLQNYITGSSYNKLDKLESAFAGNATLYLTINNEFKIITPKEYLTYFKGKPGTFNGRIGEILTIDISDDIATAKAEIIIPARKTRFTDLFLLKKTGEGWQIVSKSASYEKSNRSGNRILFIVSNAYYHGSSDIPTGNSFSEIVNAYDTFKEAGFTVDFVSPDGGSIPLAYINTSDSLHRKYLYNPDFMYALKHTHKPGEIKPEQYKAVHYIGGGSAMYGVPENSHIQKISMEIFEAYNGIISSVCHGTAGIVNLKTKEGKYLVHGKVISGYPDAYEKQDADYFKQFPFHIQKTIENRGGTFRFSPRNSPHVEVQENLVTGQNYLSSKDVAIEVIEKIKTKTDRETNRS
ncbi:nuclear transport factor 2 family protein [Sinomicrobium weinanense]|uniref:Nuclear transport factor 2 family protein n=1 Tax=Sinomicrobium weinanense TaxID=2842200 RepID=A0A926JVQ7_9FLAO|nr:nuclear transport factor 2 family protein [Sinomicrobium weinanense]MBC9798072.1 nuclear transport factor 2 family protein [Sinomicrobium weinanense]MBU3122515.1 nuclear transport factor 2 family protein [Sinomicrobium weinanense]